MAAKGSARTSAAVGCQRNRSSWVKSTWYTSDETCSGMFCCSVRRVPVSLSRLRYDAFRLRKRTHAGGWRRLGRDCNAAAADRMSLVASPLAAALAAAGLPCFALGSPSCRRGTSRRGACQFNCRLIIIRVPLREAVRLKHNTFSVDDVMSTTQDCRDEIKLKMC